MTESTSPPAATHAQVPTPGRSIPGLLLPGLVTVSVLAIVALILLADRVPAGVEVASFMDQGVAESVYAEDSARLLRRSDGLSTDVTVPTPVPGSYDYPTEDVLPPGAPPHPRVVPGGPGAPEVFTLWMFVFNFPERCSDQCDGDDIGPETAARGGVFQVDGRVARGNELEFSGGVRLGQVAGNGVALENPMGAEVHLAIAPHGRALEGADRWRQLNGPLGAVPFWWATTFLPPDSP